MIRKFALNKGFTDKADGDFLKIHKEPVALLGGVSIFSAFILGVVIIGYRLEVRSFYKELLGIIFAGALVFGVELWDDAKSIKPSVRLPVQVLAGIIVLLVGLRVNFIPISWIAIPLTLFYIVGAINAFNLTDGMDGLCVGISLIACIGFFFLGLKDGSMLLLILSAILFMGLLGFLPYNFHPARIFLGDAGSGSLGFMLGVMAVIATSKPYNIANFIAPILVISVPLLDMVLAILRRLIRRKPLFVGDRSHIYDLLLKRNWSQPKVWCVICGMQMVIVGIVLLA